MVGHRLRSGQVSGTDVGSGSCFGQPFASFRSSPPYSTIRLPKQNIVSPLLLYSRLAESKLE